jgi:hypothetical protein
MAPEELAEALGWGTYGVSKQSPPDWAAKAGAIKAIIATSIPERQFPPSEVIEPDLQLWWTDNKWGPTVQDQVEVIGEVLRSRLAARGILLVDGRPGLWWTSTQPEPAQVDPQLRDTLLGSVLVDALETEGFSIQEESWAEGSLQPDQALPVRSEADARRTAARLLKVPVDAFAESCRHYPEISAYYLWENARGGRALVIGYDGTALFANSSVSPDTHRQVFAEGRRTPLADFD